MRKLSKTTKTLILSVVFVALLGATYVAVTIYSKHIQQEQTIKNNSVLILNVDEKDIKYIRVGNANGTYSLYPNIKENSQSEYEWVIPEYPELNLDTDKIKEAVFDMKNLYGIKKITSDTKRAKEYGIDSAKASYTIFLKDGSKQELWLGDKAPGDYYYAMVNGGNGIYTINLHKADIMNYSPNMYRQKTLGYLDIEKIRYVLIEKENKKIIEIVNNGTGSQDSVESYMYMTYPMKEGVKTEAFEAFMSKFNKINVVDYVKDNPSKEDLSKYGLENGYKLIINEVYYTDGGKNVEKTHTLLLGNADSKGNIYAVYNDNKFVFTTSKTFVDTAQNIDPFNFVEKYAHLYAIKTVNSIVVKTQNKTFDMVIRRKDTGADALKKSDITYVVNKRKSIEKPFKETYRYIIGIITNQKVDTIYNKTLVCSITFNFKDGKSAVTEYYDYNDRYYGIKRSDGSFYLTLHKNLDEVLEKVAKLEENPLGD